MFNKEYMIYGSCVLIVLTIGFLFAVRTRPSTPPWARRTNTAAYKRVYTLMGVAAALFTVSLTCLLWHEYLTRMHDGKSLFNGIPFLIALAMIEVTNQVTFRIAQRNLKRAVIVKTICFWAVVLACYASNIAWLLSLAPGPAKAFIELADLPYFMAQSLVLTLYSLYPNVRFLVLFGKWEGLRKSKPTLVQHAAHGEIVN